MSDWYGNSRSNYFKVKDVEKFKEFLSKWGAEYISTEKEVNIDSCQKCLSGEPNASCDKYINHMVGECLGDKEKTVLHGFLGEEDNGGLPSHYLDEASGIEYDFDDFTKELATHLKDSEVAVMFEVGAEKLRYVTGFAMALNSKGETRFLNLDGIYTLGLELRLEVTRCEG